MTAKTFCLLNKIVGSWYVIKYRVQTFGFLNAGKGLRQINFCGKFEFAVKEGGLLVSKKTCLYFLDGMRLAAA